MFCFFFGNWTKVMKVSIIIYTLDDKHQFIEHLATYYHIQIVNMFLIFSQLTTNQLVQAMAQNKHKVEPMALELTKLEETMAQARVEQARHVEVPCELQVEFS